MKKGVVWEGLFVVQEVTQRDARLDNPFVEYVVNLGNPKVRKQSGYDEHPNVLRSHVGDEFLSLGLKPDVLRVGDMLKCTVSKLSRDTDAASDERPNAETPIRYLIRESHVHRSVDYHAGAVEQRVYSVVFGRWDLESRMRQLVIGGLDRATLDMLDGLARASRHFAIKFMLLSPELARLT